MTKLTQKGVKFNWGGKAEAAFQLINQKLCSAPILALPEGSKDFIVYCDSSIKGLGVVLMQREKKGLKGQKEAKTVKNRQGTKETRTRVKNQPKIKAGSARHSKKG
ncbi:putative reverse transcriptase domain-containing protein, partial [Tanacetum coccineum]